MVGQWAATMSTTGPTGERGHRTRGQWWMGPAWQSQIRGPDSGQPGRPRLRRAEAEIRRDSIPIRHTVVAAATPNHDLPSRCFFFFSFSSPSSYALACVPNQPNKSLPSATLLSSLLSQGTKEQEEELQPWAAATARSPRWRGRGTPRRTRAPKARLSPSIPPIPPPLLTNPIPIRSDSCPSISSLYLLAGSQLETNKKAMNIQVRTQSSPPLEPSRSVSLQSSCLLEIRGFPFPDSGCSIWIRRNQWPAHDAARFSSIPSLAALLLFTATCR